MSVSPHTPKWALKSRKNKEQHVAGAALSAGRMPEGITRSAGGVAETEQELRTLTAI